LKKLHSFTRVAVQGKHTSPEHKRTQRFQVIHQMSYTLETVNFGHPKSLHYYCLQDTGSKE